MIMPTQQTNSLRSTLQTARSHERCAEIRLDPLRAAQWLVCVEELLADCAAPELEQFCSELSDACWLARWKREEPCLSVHRLLLPALAAASISEAASADCRVRIIEDMISSLSECSLA